MRLEEAAKELQAELSGLIDRDESEVDQLVSFGCQLYVNAAAVGSAATLDQRLRLQYSFFPNGLACDAGKFRIATISPLFNGLRKSDGGIGRVASPGRPANVYNDGSIQVVASPRRNSNLYSVGQLRVRLPRAA